MKDQELTLDSVQHSAVQRLTAGVIGGGTDASSTTVGQSAPVCQTETGKLEALHFHYYGRHL